MHHSEIINHIISKRYYLYYGIIIFISLLLILLSFYGTILALLMFWLSIMSIGCILINIYRCRRFLKFYNNYFKEYDAQFNRILIEKETYKVQVPYRSYNATIQPFPKPTNVVCIETDDFLLIFFSIQYSGILQLVLKPFMFMKTDKEFCIKDKCVNLIQNFEITETDENRTIIFPNKDGIKKIIIPVQIMQ